MALLASHWGLDVILFFASVLVAAYLYMTRNFRHWAKKGAIEISPTPFLGNFTDIVLMKKSPAQWIRDLYEQYKGLPYVGFYVFDRPCLLIRDPEIVKHVMVKDFNVFFNRNATTANVDPYNYMNLFTVKNKAWKILRAKMSPMGTTMKLKRLFDLMLMVADDLDQYLEGLNLTDNGKVLDIKNFCECLHTDMMGSTLFGIRVNSLEDDSVPFRECGRKMFNLTPYQIVQFLVVFFMPHLAEITRARFMEQESCDYFRSLFWDTVNQRTQSGEKRSDFVTYVMELIQKNKDEGGTSGMNFTDDDFLAQVIGAYVAGFETSSDTTMFILYELAMNMDVQEKLRMEILDALDETNGKITYELCQKLPYLDMVISETLRMYAPLGFLDRFANEDYEIPNTGLVLKKGTPVYISVHGMHYDPEYFPDPEKFDPMRFSNENKHKIRPFTYMPFGEGPRSCLGIRWGMQQVKVGLVQLLRKYEVTRCKETLVPMVLDPKSLATAPMGGLFLNLLKIVT